MFRLNAPTHIDETNHFRYSGLIREPKLTLGTFKMSIRIYDLAKRLNIDSKEILNAVKQIGIEGIGSSLSALTEEEIRTNQYGDFMSCRTEFSASCWHDIPSRERATIQQHFLNSSNRQAGWCRKKAPSKSTVSVANTCDYLIVKLRFTSKLLHRSCRRFYRPEMEKATPVVKKKRRAADIFRRLGSCCLTKRWQRP